MSFDAGAIESRLELDRSPFQRGLALARAEARKFETDGVTAKVKADTSEATAKVVYLKDRLREVSAVPTVAKVKADSTDALLAIKPLQARLDELRRRVTETKVTVDDKAARARLDDLDLALRRVGLITSKPSVSLQGVERARLQLDGLEMRLARLSASGGSAGGRGGVLRALGGHAPGMLPLAAGAAVPMALPLAGAAAGLGASFLTPTLAGGIGGALFAKTAQASYKTLAGDIKTLTADQKAYNTATTDKGRQAALAREHQLWASLDPQQRKAVTNLHALDDAWESFQRKLQPQTGALLSTGADIARKGLTLLLPVTKASGDAIDSLATRADKALSQPFWRQFFTGFLPGEAHRALTTLGADLGHGVTGIANLMEKFAPLGHRLEGDTRRWSSEFESWTQGKGPAKFVHWVEKEGPVAAKALGALAKGVEGVAKGLSPIGQVELKALTPILNFIGKLGDEHPAVLTAIGAALLTVGAGLKAAQAASAVKGGVTTLIGLYKRLTGAADAAAGAEGRAATAGGVGGVGGVGGGTVVGEAETAAKAGGKAGWLTRALGVGTGIGGALGLRGALAITGVSSVPDMKPTAEHRLGGGATQPGGITTFGDSLKTEGQQLAFLHKLQSEGPQATATIRTLAATYPAVAAALRPVNTQMSGLTRNLLLGRVTADDVRRSISGMGDTVKRVGTTALTGGTAAAKANRDSLSQAASTLKEYRDDLISAGTPLSQVQSKTRLWASALESNAAQVFGNRRQVDSLLGSLHALPRQVASKVAVHGAAQALRDVQNLGMAMQLIHSKTVTVRVQTRGGGGALSGNVGATASLNADGGPISGPGTGTSDSIPAWLSNGEYVINARSTARHRALLDAVNADRYANGGPVKLPSWVTAGNVSSGISSSGGGSSRHRRRSGSSSSTASHGPSHSAIGNALASIGNYAGLSFLQGLEGTEPQIQRVLVTMVQRVNAAVRNHYLASGSAKALIGDLSRVRDRLLEVAKADTVVTKALAGARSQLQNLQGNASNVRSGALSNYQSLGDPSQFGSVTTLRGVLSVLGQQERLGNTFATNLRRDRHRGLDKTAYAALVAGGPGQDGNVAALLAHGTRAQITRFNRYEASLTATGRSVGATSADYLYGGRIADARRLVHSLAGDEHALTKAHNRLAKAIEDDVKSRLHGHSGEQQLLRTLRDVNTVLRGLPADLRSGLDQTAKHAHHHGRGRVAGARG